jgi:hypothetical protein
MNGKQRQWSIVNGVGVTIFYLLFTPYALDAKASVEVRNELPAPINLQAVVLQNTITLTWQWPRPEVLPIFKEFGYEVQRQDGKTILVPGTTYADESLVPGTYAYRVRVRGMRKEKGKRVVSVSDWVGPVSGSLLAKCEHAPSVELALKPAQEKYGSIPSLRMRLTGRVIMESACRLGPVSYHLDSGTGTPRNGALMVDSQGRFSTLVNVVDPDDAIPPGPLHFEVTVTAQNEIGTTTTPPYAVDVDLRNPFAPH